MELSTKRLSDISKRILESRTRILIKNPFYGLLLTHVDYGVDNKSSTAYTNGKKIVFNPDFIDSLTDTEVDIVMLHEILHIVLKHCSRGLDFKSYEFNIACDIVANSNIMYSMGMSMDSIALKCDCEPWHLTPDGKHGYLYTAEEVYGMIIKAQQGNKRNKVKCSFDADDHGIDDHGMWEPFEDSATEEEWDKLIEDAANLVSQNAGTLPGEIERKLEAIRNPKHDWRSVLTNFIHEEVNDYSFSPPDKRFEGDFFLPDFNDVDVTVKNILFMVDTSGSMSEKMITEMYSEIHGAIEQFNGKLSGWLGFFDAVVVPPQSFDSIEKFKLIRPKGGGGTNFSVIFQYIKDKMQDNMPKAVVILTDGYANFPDVKETMGIPVLWVINTDVKPPYGQLLRV